MAWVVSEEGDIGHNLSVIAAIKRLVGCKPDAELKYKALKRHRKKQEALQLLSTTKITAMIAPVFKDRINDVNLKDPSTKRLMEIIHEFPLRIMFDNIGKARPDAYFQLVFDQISWRKAQNGIEDHFKYEAGLDWADARPDWLKFDDWTNYQLLQLADILAGLGAEYIESLDPALLRICTVCFMKRKGTRFPSRPRACRGVAQLGKIDLLLTLKPLLAKGTKGFVWEEGFIVRPPAVRAEYVFVDCDIVRAKEKAAVRAG